MSYKARMEPGAYDGLRSELNARAAKAAEQIQNAARSGTLPDVRYHAGVQDGLRLALMVLEGRNS